MSCACTRRTIPYTSSSCTAHAMTAPPPVGALCCRSRRAITRAGTWCPHSRSHTGKISTHTHPRGPRFSPPFPLPFPSLSPLRTSLHLAFLQRRLRGTVPSAADQGPTAKPIPNSFLGAGPGTLPGTKSTPFVVAQAPMPVAAESLEVIVGCGGCTTVRMNRTNLIAVPIL